MTKIETTRRAMLGAMAVTPVALTVPGMAAQRTPDRRAWNAAMAAFEKAKAEDKAFDAVFDPISQKFADEVAKLPQYPDQFAVRFARGAVREFDAGKVFVEDYARPDFDKRLAEHRALVAADDERTAKIAEIDKRFGYSEAEEKWEALGDAAYKAEWVVMDTPAPDHPALLWKLEKLLEEDRGPWSAEALAQTMADSRRLLSHGRA